MKQDQDLELLWDLLNALGQTDHWTHTVKTNPEIKACEQELQDALEAVKDRLTSEEYDRIDAAAAECSSAYIDPAILYGFYVASLLSGASKRSSDLTGYIMQRIREKEGPHTQPTDQSVRV